MLWASEPRFALQAGLRDLGLKDLAFRYLGFRDLRILGFRGVILVLDITSELR